MSDYERVFYTGKEMTDYRRESRTLLDLSIPPCKLPGHILIRETQDGAIFVDLTCIRAGADFAIPGLTTYCIRNPQRGKEKAA